MSGWLYSWSAFGTFLVGYGGWLEAKQKPISARIVWVEAEAELDKNIFISSHFIFALMDKHFLKL